MNDTPRLLRDGEGDVLGNPLACTDRFMIEGDASGGRFALVEHTIAPGALAAPMHMHANEDEFTYVLAGTFAAMLGGHEVGARPGDLVFKPRGQWHTFWNPGDEPTRVLEIISPAGLEQFFRLVDAPEAEQDMAAIAEMAARIGCDVDEAATGALAERLGLRF
ncbi:MAG TPA: cupin domain-containing protein [Mycobacteriales bacterium]|nr:cupin domain-containing protein [Mycobacteriales bacterium]